MFIKKAEMMGISPVRPKGLYPGDTADMATVYSPSPKLITEGGKNDRCPAGQKLAAQLLPRNTPELSGRDHLVKRTIEDGKSTVESSTAYSILPALLGLVIAVFEHFLSGIDDRSTRWRVHARSWNKAEFGEVDDSAPARY